MNDRSLDRPWMLIAEREITTKLRDKTFIGSTVVMLFIVMVAVILPAVLAAAAARTRSPLSTMPVRRSCSRRPPPRAVTASR